MNMNDLKRVIEALIFAADAPLTPERIRETLEACTDEEIAQTVETLNSEYESAGHSFMIRQVAGGYQVTTRPEFSNWIKKLYLGRQKGRLSHAALESLAIIAFKQPISRVDIAQIRGVNSDAVIGTLLERKLVTITGRSEAVGRPLLYSTTPEFLEFFGINDLAELPKPREIEELIGKEGMPEEVLQALSSDKQLKLPISFEPETSADGFTTSGNLPLIMPVAAEASRPETNAGEIVAESASPLDEAALVLASSEEETPRDSNAAVSFSAETIAAETPSLASELDENTESSSMIDERRAGPVTIVSQEEVAHLVAQTELPDETAVVVPEAEVAPPAKKPKERKRGKRGARPVANLDEAALPQNESDALAEATPVENRGRENVAEPAADETSEALNTFMEDSWEDVATAKTEASAPEIVATPQTEVELDYFSVAEEELESATEVQTYVTLEKAKASELAPQLTAAEIFVVEEEPVVELSAINEPEAGTELDVWPDVTEVNLDEQANNKADVASMIFSEAEAQSEPEITEVHFEEHERLTEGVASTMLVEPQIQSEPNVVQVRFEEPLSRANEATPMVLSENRVEDEPEALVAHSQSEISREEVFAGEPESIFERTREDERMPAAVEMSTAPSPAIITESIGAIGAMSSNGDEVQTRAQENEAVAAEIEARGDEPAREEESGFFV